MAKKTLVKHRDPHLAHIVCCNRKCKAVYDLEPVTWIPEGGFYSSDREFCKECGGSHVTVTYPWVSRQLKTLLAQMRRRIGSLTEHQMRGFIVSLYDVLWNPPEKEWNSETFNEIVAVFQAHQLVPNMEATDE